VEGIPDLAVLIEPLLVVRRVLRDQVGILHRRLLSIVQDDEVCRRLMMVNADLVAQHPADNKQRLDRYRQVRNAPYRDAETR